jgi:hypothetical protein
MDIRAAAKCPETTGVLKLYGLDIRNASAAQLAVASPKVMG